MSTFYTLQNPRNRVEKILKLMVTTTRSKVKSRSHHEVAYPQSLSNVPTKYQLPKLYSFRDIACTKFQRSRSLHQGQKSNQDHTMTVHTYNSQLISLPNINFLHLTVSDFMGQGHYGKVKSRSLSSINFLHLSVSKI